MDDMVEKPAAINANEALQVANIIRGLAMDGVQRANSGHPGGPMGMADAWATMGLGHLRFNPSDPDWIGRDRVVLSNGHASMLQYAWLELTGNIGMDDLKDFRQLESLTPGHPEYGRTPGVECSTGPLGQGIANAVGMALAARHLGARFNTDAFKVFAPTIYCFVGDGCMMEGVSNEAASLAGTQGLANLVVIYDANQITIDGSTDLAMTENVAQRFGALGWKVLGCDGHDISQIDRVLSLAKTSTDQPVLVVTRTEIAKGSPNKAGTSASHGAPLGDEEIRLTKEALGLPVDSEFYVSDEVRAIVAAVVQARKDEYLVWQVGYESWRTKNGALAAELDAIMSGAGLENLGSQLWNALEDKASKPTATRKFGGWALDRAAGLLPGIIVLGADLAGSTMHRYGIEEPMTADNCGGRYLHCGVREFAMQAIANGMAYFLPGIRPVTSTFLVFSDYARSAIRMAALANLPVLFVGTHDSIFVGEDGPTHQPVEHLASLRAIPNLLVFRPADALETAVCYDVALRRPDGPSAIVLSRQNLPPIERDESFDPATIAQGGYIAYESEPGVPPTIVFAASGSEVGLAIESAKALADEASVRVVSVPCWELYMEQDKVAREGLIPPNAHVVVVEAGIRQGWAEVVDKVPSEITYVTVNTFGESAPGPAVAEHFGLTVEQVVDLVRDTR